MLRDSRSLASLYLLDDASAAQHAASVSRPVPHPRVHLLRAPLPGLRRGPRPRVRERQSETIQCVGPPPWSRHRDTPGRWGTRTQPDAAVSLWGCCAKGESPDPPRLSRRSRNCSRAVRNRLSRGKIAVRARRAALDSVLVGTIPGDATNYRGRPCSGLDQTGLPPDRHRQRAHLVI
jgi:hypothetical protein